jgi:hypothetical protein
MTKQTLVLAAVFFCMGSVAVGEISTRVCEADGNTPFDGRDIMVGTKLTIIVSSDTGGYWPVDSAIAGTDRDYGFLSGARALGAAGTAPFLYCWEDDQYQAISFQTDDDAVAGDWFIIDYSATAVGDCNVGFYEWFSSEPNYEIPFSHTRTRDFNKDTKVDFTDLAMFASHWRSADCNYPDWCEGADLNIDGDVDFDDLMLFVDYWLKTTRCNSCSCDFNKDTKVDFADFAILASHWQATDCGCPGWCQGTDLDTDGDVNFNDLMLFVKYWLERTK